MKIAFINTFWDRGIVGGAEKYLQKIVKDTAQSNEAVVIVTDKFSFRKIFKPTVEQKGNVKIYRFSPLNFTWYANLHKFPIFFRIIWYLFDIWNWHSYLMVKKILKKEQPDLVHSHNIYNLSTSIFSAVKSLGIPLVHMLHDYQLIEPGGVMLRGEKIMQSLNVVEKIILNLKKKFTKNIDFVIAPSNFILNLYKEFGFFTKQKTEVIRLSSEFGDTKINCLYTKEKKVFYYLGRLSQEKGVAGLVKTFKEIKNDNIELLIAGDGPEMSKIKELSKEDPRIKLLGFVSGQERIDLIKNSYYFILPSICYDNSPVTVYEAFSYSVPVIASKIGGIPELVMDKKTGLLFDLEKYNLKEVIEFALDKTDLRNQLGMDAKEYYSQNLTERKHFEKIIETYKLVISSKSDQH